MGEWRHPLEEGVIHSAGNGVERGLSGCFRAQSLFKTAFEFADFEDADAPSRSAEASTEADGVAAKAGCQAFIKAVGMPMDGGDQSRAVTILSVGIKVNFEGVTPVADVTFAHRPIGAGVVAVADGEGWWGVGLDVEPTLSTLLHDCIAHFEVPEQLVAHPGIHGPSAVNIHGST